MPLGPPQSVPALGQLARKLLSGLSFPCGPRPVSWGPRPFPCGPRPVAWLFVLALLAGCQAGSPPSKEGPQRCSAQVAREANGLLRPLRYGQCLLSIDAVLERERVEAQIRQRAAARKALAECYANQAEVKSLALALQAAQARLAKLQAEPYRPAARPQRLDPDVQRRFAAYDQELDQERYDTALAQWQQAESERYGTWLAGQRHRIGEEQANLAALARRLNQLNPDLFAAPASLGPPSVLNRQAYGRAIACQPEPWR